MQAGVSYRQAGRQRKGRLYKGPPPGPAEHARRTAASIPAKFETILHSGEREADAFGSRSMRFGAVETEVPGPGSYTAPGAGRGFVRATASESKKGYGALVSRSARFSDLGEWQSAHMPGPGSYAPRSTLSSAASSTIVSKSSFGTSRRGLATPGSAGPAPGQYDVTGRASRARERRRRKMARKRGAGKSGFSSTASRFRSQASDTPAVGEYEPVVPRRRRSGGPSAAFKSTSKRGAHVMPVAEDEPGPGAYAGDEKTRLREMQRRAPTFGSDGLDRFGRPRKKRVVEEDLPGPGDYAPPVASPPRRALASSSMFVSTTSRMPRRRKEAPGPAFYTPDAPGKKTFMLNARRRWV